MLEEYLVTYCSPTLAALKTANMFNWSFRSQKEQRQQIKSWNEQLSPKGISITVLREGEEKALLYVYRKKRLERDLKRPEVAEFLRQRGYENLEPEQALKRLKERFSPGGEFPHEIGLFLGYPLEDVQGFIVNQGKNSTCSGYWKVYGDAAEALKQFARFEKCRVIYQRLFGQGRGVWQLAVADSG